MADLPMSRTVAPRAGVTWAMNDESVPDVGFGIGDIGDEPLSQSEYDFIVVQVI